jgi:CRISPR-associated protein Csx10
MSIKMTFRIKLSSDYHIGAGFGKGANLDSALLRDADGVPVIRGTAMSGLLRDSLYHLLQQKPLAPLARCRQSGVDDGERYCGQGGLARTQEACPVCRLFGTPQKSKHWKISSARPVNRLKQGFGAMNEPGQVEQHVRIDPRTRRAQPRKLYTNETWFEDQGYQFTIESKEEDESILDEAALWMAAARNLRQLGRARQRGQGQIVIQLIDLTTSMSLERKGGQDDQVVLLDRFESVWLRGNPATRQPKYLDFHTVDQSSEVLPVRVRIVVRLDEPLLIARRAEAGNQFESQLYISGQTVRGAFGWRAAQRFNLQPGSAAYESFVHNFLHDGASFPWLLPAKFESGFLRPTINAPRDMLTCKLYPGEPSGGHGIFFGSRLVDNSCPTCKKPLKEVNGFVTLYGGWKSEDFLYHPKRTTEMHIRIEPETGRVATGDLFGYMALDAGQYFTGDLLCNSASIWSEMKMLCDITEKKTLEFHLGKASLRGYGQVTAWFEVVDWGEDVWRPKAATENIDDSVQLDTPDEFQLTLLTDAVIMDEWGRAAIGFEENWLQRELDITDLEIISASSHYNAVDGFNGLLGLPRWRDTAIAAGSTVRLRSTTALSTDVRSVIEQKRIGLRTGEGFGRIAINHPIYDKCIGITTSLVIPDDLGLESYKNIAFTNRWSKVLSEEKWSKCADVRFSAIARWLDSNQAASPSDLSEKLSGLGKPGKNLIDEISDYGSRDKENKLQAKEQGINLVKAMLAKLDKEDSAHSRQGIHILANFVAEASKPKRE